jgi:hypothetical protein
LFRPSVKSIDSTVIGEFEYLKNIILKNCHRRIAYTNLTYFLLHHGHKSKTIKVLLLTLVEDQLPNNLNLTLCFDARRFDFCNSNSFQTVYYRWPLTPHDLSLKKKPFMLHTIEWLWQITENHTTMFSLIYGFGYAIIRFNELIDSWMTR